MPTVPNQGVDTFILNAKAYAGQVWAGIALGRKGFLSSPVAFAMARVPAGVEHHPVYLSRHGRRDNRHPF